MSEVDQAVRNLLTEEIRYLRKCIEDQERHRSQIVDGRAKSIERRESQRRWRAQTALEKEGLLSRLTKADPSEQTIIENLIQKLDGRLRGMPDLEVLVAAYDREIYQYDQRLDRRRAELEQLEALLAKETT